MDLTAVSGVGATGALMAVIAYLLTYATKDRSTRASEVERYAERLAHLEIELDRQITQRRIAEDEAARLRIELMRRHE